MDLPLAFERLLTQVLGQKRGYQTASQFGNPNTRNNWLREALRLMLKEVNDLDATTRHKQLLMRELQSALDNLPTSYEPVWEVVFPLVTACSRFLGFDYAGAKVYTPSYSQSQNQRFTQVMFEGAESQLEQSKEDAVTIRARLCKELRFSGVDTFTIALALNISEYQVKKLIRESA